MTSRIKPFQLPDTERRDACGLSERVSALESKVDHIENSVGTLSAEMSELSVALKEAVDRSESLSIEMGGYLRRYAEYTERNIQRSSEESDLRVKLELLVEILTDTAKKRGI